MARHKKAAPKAHHPRTKKVTHKAVAKKAAVHHAVKIKKVKVAKTPTAAQQENKLKSADRNIMRELKMARGQATKVKF